MKALKIIFLFMIVLGALKAFAAPDDTAYFNQFLFRKENTSQDPDFPTYSYRYLMSEYKFVYQLPNGKYVGPRVALILLADGTFWMEYAEFYLNSPDDQQFDIGPCKRIQGNWSVPTNKLQLADFAAGDRATVDSVNAVVLNFTKDMASPGLTNVPMKLSMGFSDFDPRQPNFFCN